MPSNRSKTQTGRDARSWPVLLLLIVLVLVPTVGVLWFMSQAMRNEQLAVRQKLTDIYQAQLLGLQQELQAYWQTRATELDGLNPDLLSSLIFAQQVRDGSADSVVVYDSTGRPAYPAPPQMLDLHPSNGSWRRAERLERSGDNTEAATQYAEIAASTTDRNVSARALQAQARCLAKAGQTQDAISILADKLGHDKYITAVDSQGRLIKPDAQRRALELMGDGSVPAFQNVAEALRARLADYDEPALPAAQRRFLMKQLTDQLNALSPQSTTSQIVFDTLPAEDLAARYIESDPPAPPTTSLQPSGLPNIWHLASPSGKVVALFDQEHLLQDLESLIGGQSLGENATVELLPPGIEPDALVLVSLPAGGFLQDWLLILRPEDQTLFETAANQRIKAYLLTGGLVVAVILILTVLIARAVDHQLKLTRLKNNLLSTVSHELKTPLASMRLLVDTLLETGIDDSQRVREYLHLISKENIRLSRLVDNFLTFSRMEKNPHSFDKKRVLVDSVVEDAATSVAERFRAPGCRFEVQVTPNLPPIVADHDALVTMLLNLLDNAYKYSSEDKHIMLLGYCENSHVCLAVQDNGIGLSDRVTGKVFDRFYQVDQSLSRPESGCGLGLSIVEFIVSAHDGSVEIESQAGVGSTFTVRLPAEPDEQEGTILDAR